MERRCVCVSLADRRTKRPGQSVIEAAVGPDISFTRIGAALGASRPAVVDNSFNGISLPNPPGGLAGDPEVVGNVVTTGGGTTWLAVALESNGRIRYRIYELPQQGHFDISSCTGSEHLGTTARSASPGCGSSDARRTPHLESFLLHPRNAGARAQAPGSLSSLRSISTADSPAAAVFLRKGSHVISSRRLRRRHRPVDDGAGKPAADATVPGNVEPAFADVARGDGEWRALLLVFGDAYHRTGRRRSTVRRFRTLSSTAFRTARSCRLCRGAARSRFASRRNGFTSMPESSR